MRWKKQGLGYVSEGGRFEIIRYIRRNGTEWQLVDRLVPVEPNVNGCVRTLQEAKAAAEWRLDNSRPAWLPLTGEVT